MKDIRSRWAHPDDKNTITLFAAALVESRESQHKPGVAVKMANLTDDMNFAVEGLAIISERAYYPLDYAANGRLLHPGKTQLVKDKDIKTAKKKIK